MEKKLTLKELIEKHLGFQGKTDDKAWLQASAKHYLESGTVTGSFYSAIESIVKEVAKESWDTARGSTLRNTDIDDGDGAPDIVCNYMNIGEDRDLYIKNLTTTHDTK